MSAPEVLRPLSRKSGFVSSLFTVAPATTSPGQFGKSQLHKANSVASPAIRPSRRFANPKRSRLCARSDTPELCQKSPSLSSIKQGSEGLRYESNCRKSLPRNPVNPVNPDNPVFLFQTRGTRANGSFKVRLCRHLVMTFGKCSIPGTYLPPLRLDLLTGRIKDSRNGDPGGG
jgi:hypothetical protein